MVIHLNQIWSALSHHVYSNLVDIHNAFNGGIQVNCGLLLAVSEPFVIQFQKALQPCHAIPGTLEGYLTIF